MSSLVIGSPDALQARLTAMPRDWSLPRRVELPENVRRDPLHELVAHAEVNALLPPSETVFKIPPAEPLAPVLFVCATRPTRAYRTVSECISSLRSLVVLRHLRCIA